MRGRARAHDARSRSRPARRPAQPARTRALRLRAAAAAARRLRALRAGLHAADLPRQRRLHARPGGQPLHDWSPTPTTSRGATGIIGDLIPLLGDGLLTIDGDFHRRARRIMLPAFHRERDRRDARHDARRDRRARSTAGTTARRVDLYAWTRGLALRIAMRALFGLDPDGRARAARTPPHEFEHALGFWAQRLPPADPARAAHAVGADAAGPRARLDALIYGEIDAPAARPASAARTSSRCCSTPPTRTAAASTTSTSATRS